ncbi:precorrin-8X methylmutase [Tessaracoccus massiliensis]|uniref:precorrin-8X methylmutase n=1 Tax=Tessaracoccus massiliensis TaxID=1522311 RepID=UPI00058D5305|nr:precorrin-8X methylmutase [Tessaracoccus massiliensis]
MSYQRDPQQIYRESFEIIRREANMERFPADVEPVVARMIHASGSVDLADDIDFTPGVAASARAALLAGAPILCDSTMVATGIIRSRLPRDNEVVCHLSDPALAQEAEALGTTKTAAAVERWRDQLDGAIVAIGNAPTSLFRLLEVLAETDARPAAVIGIPVGFVGAAESKEALRENDFGLDYLVVRGRRGGSAVTCAAVNAIASRAEMTNESV